jgi:hypothetical protein
LAHTTALALRNSHLDELTRAHIEALGEVARQALDARNAIGVKTPGFVTADP